MPSTRISSPTQALGRAHACGLRRWGRRPRRRQQLCHSSCGLRSLAPPQARHVTRAATGTLSLSTSSQRLLLASTALTCSCFRLGTVMSSLLVNGGWSAESNTGARGGGRVRLQSAAMDGRWPLWAVDVQGLLCMDVPHGRTPMGRRRRSSTPRQHRPGTALRRPNWKQAQIKSTSPVSAGYKRASRDRHILNGTPRCL